jgi:hypothetical protein
VVKQPVNRKKVLIIVSSVLILFVTVIETGLVNTGLYRIRTKSSYKTKWENVVLAGTDEFPNEEQAREKAYVNNGNREKVIHRNATIIAAYEDKTYTIEADTSYIIRVELSNFNHGAIWTPFIKSTSFNADAEINQGLSNYKATGNHVSSKFHDLHGRFNITGTVSIVGLCSYKDAGIMLIQTALKTLAEAVRAEVLNTETY